MMKFIPNCLFHLKTLYLFTASDIRTIILPAACFGLVIAFSATLFTSEVLSILQIVTRLHCLILWEYINLLAFNTSNQSQPKAIIEDEFNKPFRAIPSGRITAHQTINLYCAVQLSCFITSYLWTGGFLPSLVLAVLSWLFNFLHLGEKGVLIRYFMNAAGYVCFFAGGTEAIFGSGKALNQTFWAWCASLALAIFTTVHAQDFQDQEGDRESGKLTLPLLIGEGTLGRLSIAIPVSAWSILLPWALGRTIEKGGSLNGYILTIAFGLPVCWKVFKGKDHATWRSMYKWYNVWLMALIALPLAVVHNSYW